jgi:hypothetical protein
MLIWLCCVRLILVYLLLMDSVLSWLPVVDEVSTICCLELGP